ncbi:MAG TPA: endo-1,4-beta-xylanase [Candidatus Sumerlaeota bacterium]|nr:endo-1,4-beta-xylanase [Candidatus Sumerlaeota bacterium]
MNFCGFVSLLTGLVLFINQPLFPQSRKESDTPVPSEQYRKLWNDPALQQSIEQNIEKYRKSNAVIILTDPRGNPVPEASITVEQVTHDFLFGSNLFVLGQLPTPEANQKYEAAFLKLFNFASVPFYWRGIEPEQGKLRYEEGTTPDIWRRPPPDRLVAWCLKNNITPKGHPLLWHEHNPEWLPRDAEELRRLYIKRFGEISERYGRTVPIWDCVNEPTICIKEYPLYSEDNAYVAWAFNTARKMFPPAASLLINETPHICYEYAGKDGKDTRYYKTVRRLIGQGVQMDGIGFQLHIMSDYGTTATLEGKMFAPGDIVKVHGLYEEFGLPQYVTEITVPTRGADTALARKTQAEVVRNFYRLWFSLPNMAGITWWNLGDGTAIEHEDLWNGGLLDVNLDPKPSFLVLDQLINHDWKTKVQGAADQNGRFEFRGFNGTYRAIVETGAVKKEFTFPVRPDAETHKLVIGE